MYTGKKARDNYFRYRQQNVGFVHNYLLHHPCVDCGEKDVRVLDFDHVRGKKYKSVSKMLSGSHSIDRLIEEIKKCEVRCANCHRKITAERAGNFSHKYLTEEVPIEWINGERHYKASRDGSTPSRFTISKRKDKGYDKGYYGFT